MKFYSTVTAISNLSIMSSIMAVYSASSQAAPAKAAAAPAANSDSVLPLTYFPLNPTIPCGDGSPAGFYTDAFATNDGVENRNHVINFMGGGGCGSHSSCEAIWEQQPYMLSSLFEPSMIDGATILSNDLSDNPAMASFSKWNVPYCSQDLWLGNSGESDNFVRSGSAIVEAVMSRWLDEVTQAQAQPFIDILVISGVSAGGMAVLNHFPLFQSVAQAAGVKSLRLVLDSSLYPDAIDTDFSHLIEQVVDPQQHPLCFEEQTRELQHETLSRLPCCLSTHCMLRHNIALSDWARGTYNISDGDLSGLVDTQMLLIDSAYDSLQAFIELSSDTSPRNALPASDGISSLDGVASTTLNIAEYAGRRKSRVAETLFGGERQLGSNNLQWVVTSAPGHNVLVPSIDLSSRLCDAMKATRSSCEGARDCVFSNYPLGILPVCNATGSGLRMSLNNGLNMTLWTTKESWNLIKVNGQSIRNIISRFVIQDQELERELRSERGHENVTVASKSILLMESCPGPNCVSSHSIGEENAANSLIEIDSVFAPLPMWLRILVTILLGSLPLFFIVTVCGFGVKEMKKNQDKGSSDASAPSNKTCGTNLSLNGLSVISNKGDKILDNVSVDFKSSTLTCLLGKSGSGKSCFLGTLSLQLRSNLKVQYVSSTDLNSISCTFMRQQDFGMRNMTPNEYLNTTATVYGTSKERFDFVLGLVRPFFPVKTESNENADDTVSLDPFNNVTLKELSGGQRRMISIATALFQESQVLLLDEPLSGVDSASSENIVDLLANLTKNKSIIVIMTMHQPSDSILSKMDKVMVLGGGSLLFDSDYQQTTGMRAARSSSNLVHSIISEGTLYETDLALTPSETEDWDEDNVQMCSVHEHEHEEVGSFQCDHPMFKWRPRLWQVVPLLKRLCMEYPIEWKEIIVLPVSYLILSAWGSLGSDTSPIQRFTTTGSITVIPSILFQSRLVVNYGSIECHRWDLEDNRISPLSYLIASGIHVFAFPVVCVAVSFFIFYANSGWNFDSIWDAILFSNLLLISNLQLGKVLNTVMPSYQGVVGVYSVYFYLSAVVSGFFVNPAAIPHYLHWIMHLSFNFWSLSGVILSQLQHFDVGNRSCLTLASCLAYNPNLIAQLSGYTTVTSTQNSMVALIIAVILLLLSEYFFLMKRVSRRGNYKQVKATADSSKISNNGVNNTSTDHTIEATSHSLPF